MTTAVRWRLTAQKNFGFMKKMSRILSVPLQKNCNDRKILYKTIKEKDIIFIYETEDCKGELIECYMV